TAFVAGELAKLNQAGARSIGIVGHSMGGLIARHLLTDDRWYGGRGAGHDRYPDVIRLVMVAVPQRGSQLVRLRIVTEARDQIARMLSGDGMLFGGIFDGAGEAKLDLLPNSEFLIGLNRRSLPRGVGVTIIAGNASPVSEAGIGRVADNLKERFGDRLEERIEKISSSLQSLSSGMGDGAVSLASTRLEGVDDYHVVRANHLSMLRSLIPGSPSVPPAIPIILERLTQER
ncbi:MAG: hypothetical protein OER86_04985, partial [Phycisphaerae bacterium]|nr:hypothetical protein [Phycisphaerae bacterium]